MPNIAIVLNPAAGRGQGGRRRPEMERLLREIAGTEVSWRIIETKESGDGSALARQAAEDGAEVVAAAGGDGTLNEIVNGLVGTGVKLGVIPLGTGNDFARCIGIGVSLETAVNTLLQGKPRAVDLGQVKERWFINVAGCGFDAIVAERVNRGFRFMHGTAAYVAALCQSLISLRPADLHLTLDGTPLEVRALMCTVANAASYGGGMRIAPDAQIDDGLFDICVLREAGRWEFVRAFPRVFKGTHVTHPKVCMHRAREVTVASDPPLPILIDGEVSGTTPVTFTNVPGAIEVMAPDLPR